MMKLKRVLSGLLVGAMLLTGIPSIGLDGIGLSQTYASIAASTENIALKRPVTVSSYQSGTTYMGEKAVDGILTSSAGQDESRWRSGELIKTLADGSQENKPQWLQIELDGTRSLVDSIAVTFYESDEWAPKYKIETSASGREGSWTTVATIENDADGMASSHYQNTITRTGSAAATEEEGSKIVLQKYVRFYFETAHSSSRRISVAEIQIFGTAAAHILAPTVEITAPEEGEYPAVSNILANDVDTSVHHTNLADRTTPASTLIKATTDVQLNEDGTFNVTPDMLFESMDDFEVDGNEDGVWGFNAYAKTIGSQNKFNVDGDYKKVISFKLYMKKFSTVGSLNAGGGLTIYSKGSRYMMQTDVDCIKIAMQNASGAWVNEAYRFSADEKSNDAEKSFLNKWHDILVVIDGEGNQRLYVDGKCSTKEGGNTDATNPDVDINVPFSLCCNASNANPLENAFTSDLGYIAQFKFYSDQSYNNVVNGAGTDITDAAILDPEVAAQINIGTLEGKYGNHSDDAANIITSLLQTQRPTVRFTLCPYDRSTVWSKWDTTEETWIQMAADEKFDGTSSYCVTTKLTADDGFVFDQDSRDKLTITAEGADYKVANLSDNDRVLTVTAYYIAADADADDMVSGSCQLEELILDNDEITVSMGDISDSKFSLGDYVTPTVRISKCAKHESAQAKITYTVTEGTDYITVDSEAGEVTVKNTSKLVMGYAPVTIEVKAVLVDENGAELHETVDGVTVLTDEISVCIEPEVEEQTITTAPTIKTTVPVAGSYPEIADVKMNYAENATNIAKYTDIGDRMQPNATINQMTTTYMQTIIAKMIEDKANGGWGLTSTPGDLPSSFETPTIANTEGVWGFNGQGQTPGLENKFDVYGDDVKLISFKLYLKEWPESGNVSIFGKGDKYAVQMNSSGQIFMFMENTNGAWPQETYTASNKADFLNTWHDVFMVVDGKGKQRIYVDGVPSTSRNASLPAIAKETPSHGKQPFTIGYNLADTDGSGAATPTWWKQMFTSDYGYIADLEFYTDKNYYGMINGAGTDISDAQVLDEETAKFIDISKLETTYGTTGNIKTVLLNVLQQQNATAAITVTPYAAKTVWYAVDGSNKTILDPKEMIMGKTSYESVTTLTAYDGFKFDSSITSNVESNFTTNTADEEDDMLQQVTAEVSDDGKTLTVTATYSETAEADCTCAINSLGSGIEIELDRGQTDLEYDILTVLENQISKNPCAVGDHALSSENSRYDISYVIKTGTTTNAIEITDEGKLIAKKPGTATLTVTVNYQAKGENDTWTTITNHEKEQVTRTEDITVTVTRRGQATEAYKADLKALIPADGTYVEEDYADAVWSEYNTAYTEAVRVRDESDVTEDEVDDAYDALEAALAKLAQDDNKSEVGKKKDAVRDAVAAAADDYGDGTNADGIYTADSWTTFKNAYDAANGDLTGKSVEELNTLITNLTTAQGNLAREADQPADNDYKQSLDDLIPEDGTYLDEDYDADALEELQDKIDAAKAVISDSSATKGDVDTAKSELQAAIDALAEAKTDLRVAKDDLLQAVADAEEIYPSEKDTYTAASWKDFEDAYNAANLTEAQMKGMEKSALEALKTALTNAKDALEEKSEDGNTPTTPTTPTTPSGPSGSQNPTTQPPSTTPPASTVKDGDLLTGADGTGYKVSSAKDKTVIITKGVDKATVKIAATVKIGTDTYKIVGIGSKAFANAKKLKKLVIGANVTSIDAQAFTGCKKLTNVTLGKGVVTIGKKAFFKCTKLKKVIIQGTAIKTVKGNAFKNTAAKVTVKWPKGLKAKQKTALKKKLKRAKMKVK